MNDFSIESIFTKKNMDNSLYRYRKERINKYPPFKYWKHYGNDVLNDIYMDIYRPQPMKCFFIRKKSGGKRMITVPTTLDKILQRATAISLENYYDKCFSEYSFAFRKGKSKTDALDTCLDYLNQGYEYILRLDIKNYFNEINKNKLNEILLNSIEDGRIVSWIMRVVNTPICLEGALIRQKSGISQGSPLSPCLANIYLNELDCYMNSYAMNYVRYADDILVFCKDANEAKELLAICKRFINKELLLDVNQDKIKIDRAYHTEFLGFKFMKGKSEYLISVSDDNIIKQREKIKNGLMFEKNDLVELWKKIGRINRGWTNYYQGVEEENIIPILQSLDQTEFEQLIRLDKNVRDEVLLYSQFTFNEIWYLERMYKEGKCSLSKPHPADNI